MVDPVTIGWNTNKWLKDSDTKVLSLFDKDGGGNHSMHSSTDGLVYLVPVDKIAYILGVDFYGTRIQVGKSLVLDTFGTVLWESEGSTAMKTIPTWIEIPAGYYCHVYVTGSNTESTMIGIETSV